MKHLRRFFAIAVSLPVAASAQQRAAAAAPEGEFIVHEWGTFTSMVGSDGVALEGLHHEEERLPDFCHELASLVESPGGTGDAPRLKFPASRVTQKMETPVIYFHTDRPRDVSVRVYFPDGLLTQFYPIPLLVSPTLGERRARGPIDLSTIQMSSLAWQIELLPFDGPAPEQIPTCAADDPWALARQVRAAFVRTKPPRGAQRAIEAEHYLFYRGLGHFDTPLRLRAKPGGVGQLTNGSSQAIPFAVVLENAPPDAQGETRSRFTELGAIEAEASIDYDLGGAATATFADRDRSTAALGARVLNALVAQGLYDDEARAMIATWSRSWFRTPGTRVIYLLPSLNVSRMLPLRIQPQPDSTVRVLVGRLEWIAPETEAGVLRALRTLESQDPEAVVAARQTIHALDRFAEPHLRRALQQAPADSPEARQARRLLTELVGATPTAGAPAEDTR